MFFMTSLAKRQQFENYKEGRLARRLTGDEKTDEITMNDPTAAFDREAGPRGLNSGHCVPRSRWRGL